MKQAKDITKCLQCQYRPPYFSPFEGRLYGRCQDCLEDFRCRRDAKARAKRKAFREKMDALGKAPCCGGPKNECACAMQVLE